MLLHIEACHSAPQRNRAKILPFAEIDVISSSPPPGEGDLGGGVEHSITLECWCSLNKEKRVKFCKSHKLAYLCTPMWKDLD